MEQIFQIFNIMNDLIKALTILNKYLTPEDRWPTWCGHDVFGVIGFYCEPENVFNELLELITKVKEIK